MSAVRRLESFGISLLVPAGWEARFTGPVAHADDDAYPYLHAANFALPARRAPFGAGVVGEMRQGDAFVALLEYGPECAETPLFVARGAPTRLQGGDFAASALQRSMRGQTGCQRFFHEGARAFCIYVVLEGRAAHARPLEDVNALLSSVRVHANSAAR